MAHSERRAEAASREYWEMVTSLARRAARRAGIEYNDAEDCVADYCLKLLVEGHAADQGSAGRPVVPTAIIQRHVWDWRAENSRIMRRTTPIAAVDAATGGAGDDALCQVQQDPEAAAIMRQVAATAIALAKQTLSDSQFQLWFWIDVYGMTPAELQGHLGGKTNTLQNKLQRARAKLRTALKGIIEFPES